MSHIGSNIKRLREECKESIGQVSKMVGITHRALANIEKGVTTSPGIDIIAEIAKHFQVKMDDLYYGTWDQKQDQDILDQLKKIIKTPDRYFRIKGVEVHLKMEAHEKNPAPPTL